ncbi:MAG: hypothetical protein LBR54_02425 [Oscillospiraceae bacterium]|jgi:hypothetical protein|nr:hypothetical protein [Oscillospiraceae bacterium]
MKRRQKLKGTILFTTVSVLLVITVLVLATLALSAAANKRANNNYFKDQSLYTARSVANAVTSFLADGARVTESAAIRGRISAPALANDINSPEAHVEAANNVNSAGRVELDVDFGNSVGLAGIGEVWDNSISVELVGYDLPGSDWFVNGTGKGVVKLTVVTEYQGQVSTYDTFMLLATLPGGVPPGFIVLDAYGMAANNIAVYGPAAVLQDSGQQLYRMDNTGAGIQEGVFGVDVDFNTAGQSSYFVEPKKGITFEKSVNFTTSTGGLNFPSTMGDGPNKNYGYNEIPYIYVGKLAYARGGGADFNFGGNANRTKDNPITLYTGTFNLHNVRIRGDLYGFDYAGGTDPSNGDSTTYTIGEGTDGAVTGTIGENLISNSREGWDVLKWTEDLVTGEDNAPLISGGNIYTNGNLTLEPRTSRIGGGIYCRGDLNINTAQNNGNTVITGDIYCAGDFSLTVGMGSVQIDGTVYADDPQGLAAANNGAGVPADKIKPFTEFPDEVRARLELRPGTYSGYNSETGKVSLEPGVSVTGNQHYKNDPAYLTFVRRAEDTKSQFLPGGKPNSTIYKSQPEDTSCYDDENIYTGGGDGGRPLPDGNVITKSSTFVAGRQNSKWENITIRPQPNQDIWIALIGFQSTDASNNFLVTIDNTDCTEEDPKGAIVNGERTKRLNANVNFFVPARGDSLAIEAAEKAGRDETAVDGNFSAGNCQILMQIYKDAGTKNISLYMDYDPDDDGNRLNRDLEYRPNVFFYMAGIGDPNVEGSNPRFSIGNQFGFTGYLFAPYATVTLRESDQGSNLGGIQYYADSHLGTPDTPGTLQNEGKGNRVLVVGCVVVDSVVGIVNVSEIYIVSPWGRDGDGGEDGEWTPISNSYDFGS